MLEKDFFSFQAQTTPHPLGLQVAYAKGSYIYDTNQKSYLDFVAGVSACSLGHANPKVIQAIKEQADRYLHVMVYGEFMQEATVRLAKCLASQLPSPLHKTYFTNSGTEAIEGAIKLARRVTGRSQLLAAAQAYHGSTLGALSLMGFEARKRAFRPLLPDVRFIRFNAMTDCDMITSATAAVILETIQGGAGCILPSTAYLQAIKAQCEKVGALLILDEIQPGFGRTGKLFGFQYYGIQPDILVMGKGMGGGMPIGAFTSSANYMDQLQDQPKLGHITTFGGNPVATAAALATLQHITTTSLMADTLKKEQLFRDLLVHPLITGVRGKGLMLACVTISGEIATEAILRCKEKGLILFWFLFESKAIRITPPLTISEEEIKKGCRILLDVFDQIANSRVEKKQ